MIDLKNPTIVLANGEFPKHQSALDFLNFDYNLFFFEKHLIFWKKKNFENKKNCQKNLKKTN